METGTRRLTGRRRYAWLVIRIGIGIALLVAMVSMLDFQRVVETFTQARVPFLAAGIMLSLANIGSQVVKWRYLLSLVHPGVTWRASAMSVLFGNSLGVVTPGHFGEFVGRALHLREQSPFVIGGMALVDRLQNLFLFAIGAAVALAAFSFMALEASLAIASLFVLMLVFGGALAIRWARRTTAAIKPAWLEEMFRALKILGAPQWLASIAYSAMFYCVILMQMFCFLNAFQSVSLLSASAGWAMTLFVKSFLPISFGDLGVREAASVYFFSRLGVQPPAAFNAAFLMFVVNIMLPGIAGVFFTPALKKSAASPDPNKP